MLITRKADYAVRCVLALSEDPERSATAAELAQGAEVSEDFAAKVAQALVRAGLLVSERGAHGGYRLAREPEEISLLDVVEAIQGQVCINECVTEGLGCHRAAGCPVHFIWADIREELVRRLRTTHFEALVHRAASVTLALRRTEG